MSRVVRLVAHDIVLYEWHCKSYTLTFAFASALNPMSSNATPCPEFDLNVLSYCVVSTRFAQEVALLPAAAE